jgi:hypothetical protein
LSLTASAEQLAHLGIFDPQEAGSEDELRAANDSAGLSEGAGDRIRQGRDLLDARLNDVGLEPRSQRQGQGLGRDQYVERTGHGADLDERRE